MKHIVNEPIIKLTNLNILRIPLIALSVISVLFIVYLTDGTKNGYLQLIFIPIIVSAYFWWVSGGVNVAVVSGILAGPLMPLSVSEGIMQSYDTWITRLLILSFVGFVTGYLFKKVDKLDKKERERDFVSPFTGLYNTNKLILDLEKRMNNGGKFAIVSIKLTNIEGVGKYIEQRFVDEILGNLINELLLEYDRDAVYSSGYDEVNFITNGGYLEKCERIIKRYSTAFKIEQFTLRVSMKIGIYEYNGSNETPIDVYNRARIACEQGMEQESGIFYHKKEFETKRKAFFEISGSLLEAINNKEMYLVYQPKINIADHTISGVEVLIRWDRGEKNPVGPSVFIKLAEDIGFIKEISKFVLKNTCRQMVEWNDKGMATNVSINFTGNELLDNDFVEWGRKIIEGHKISKSKLELEITERVVSNKSGKLIERLHEFRAMGYKISIDDCGTGINSLMRMVEIPCDQLKIDKYFIDHIDRLENRELIKAIINYAHELNKTVVAEGVETAEQLKILKDIKCDIVQGYYYSKPLLPHEFEKYYFDFYFKKYAIAKRIELPERAAVS